jgi:hypothetical protein
LFDLSCHLPHRHPGSLVEEVQRPKDRHATFRERGSTQLVLLAADAPQASIGIEIAYARQDGFSLGEECE